MKRTQVKDKEETLRVTHPCKELRVATSIGTHLGLPYPTGLFAARLIRLAGQERKGAERGS